MGPAVFSIHGGVGDSVATEARYTARGVAEMLLTLSAVSLQDRLRGDGDRIDLLDLPMFVRERLDLFGLQMPTSMFAGADLRRLERFRDEADKAGCPCLVLVEPEALPMGDPDDSVAEAAAARCLRVVEAAHRLGCNAAAFRYTCDSEDEDTVDLLAERARDVLMRAERLELNMLIAPHKGVTETPEKLTTLLKKIGGFRIGSLPDFEAASKAEDPGEYMRRITPYASAVVAASTGFDAKGVHKAYDLGVCVDAVLSVGYEGALSIEYRGPGDPVKGIKATREAIEQACEAAK